MSFGLGTFADDTHTFAGLVLDGARVVEVEGTTLALLQDWDRSFERLTALADSAPRWRRARVVERAVADRALRPDPLRRRQLSPSPAADALRVRAPPRQPRCRRPSCGPRPRRTSSNSPRRAHRSSSPGCPAPSAAPTTTSSSSARHRPRLGTRARRRHRSHGLARRAPSDALEHVAGYTIANDISTRDVMDRPNFPMTDFVATRATADLQAHRPLHRARASSSLTHATCRSRSRVNGDVMQDESTSDIIYGVEQLIELRLARCSFSRPGDLLLTGSPAGNAAHHGNRWLRARRRHRGRDHRPRRRSATAAADEATFTAGGG